MHLAFVIKKDCTECALVAVQWNKNRMAFVA